MYRLRKFILFLISMLYSEVDRSCLYGSSELFSWNLHNMYSKLFDSQMLTTEMIHLRKYYQTYEVHAFLPLFSVTPVFCGHDSGIKMELL